MLAALERLVVSVRLERSIFLRFFPTNNFRFGVFFFYLTLEFSLWALAYAVHPPAGVCTTHVWVCVTTQPNAPGSNHLLFSKFCRLTWLVANQHANTIHLFVCLFAASTVRLSVQPLAGRCAGCLTVKSAVT